MPKLPYAEIFRVMRYEYTYTLTAAKVCFSLKVVNCREHKSKILSIYSLKCTNLSCHAVMQICLAERTCTLLYMLT